MKYLCTVIIDLPLEKAANLWNDEAHFSKWQDGFQSIELLSGTANTKGAKSRILIEGKQKIELIETIISNDLPKEKIALYEHKHMTNTQTTRFKSIDTNKTEFTSIVEYTKFNGFIIKVMAKLFPNMFQKQSQKWMDQFKQFAEKRD